MMVDGAEERQIMGLIDLLAPYTTTTSIVRVAAWISGQSPTSTISRPPSLESCASAHITACPVPSCSV